MVQRNRVSLNAREVSGGPQRSKVNGGEHFRTLVERSFKCRKTPQIPSHSSTALQRHLTRKI